MTQTRFGKDDAFDKARSRHTLRGPVGCIRVLAAESAHYAAALPIPRRGKEDAFDQTRLRRTSGFLAA